MLIAIDIHIATFGRVFGSATESPVDPMDGGDGNGATGETESAFTENEFTEDEFE